MINILNPDGTLNENGPEVPRARPSISRPRGAWSRISRRWACSKTVEDREIDLAHSDRSKTPIEPYLSDQWFVKMGDHDDGTPGLAQMAMDAVTERPREDHSRALRQELPRLARREARLVHQPAALVGASDTGVVRDQMPTETIEASSVATRTDRRAGSPTASQLRRAYEDERRSRVC